MLDEVFINVTLNSVHLEQKERQVFGKLYECDGALAGQLEIIKTSEKWQQPATQKHDNNLMYILLFAVAFDGFWFLIHF